MPPAPSSKLKKPLPWEARLKREQRARQALEGMLGDRARRLSEANKSLLAELEERKRLEEQLVQAQKLEAMGHLAAGVAHEINTPIQFVGDNLRFLQESGPALLQLLRLYDELIERATEGPLGPADLSRLEEAQVEVDLGFLLEELPRAVEEGLQGVDRVARIVRGMKTLSHPGGADLRPFDLNATLRSTVDVARHEWKYVADVRLSLAKDLPLVEGDEAALNQAFLNLIVNAAHAVAEAVESGRRGRITITSKRRSAGAVEVCVIDTGVGIPEENRRRIFDPFFTTKDVGKGTGQGLGLVHAIVVDKHAGRIDLDSKVGCGTRFRVTLPIRQPQASAEAA